MRTSTVRTAMAATAIALSVLAGGAVTATAAPSAPPATSVAVTAPKKADTETLWLRAENKFRPGQKIELSADAGNNSKGEVWTRATVVGPRGMKAKLTPSADRGYLTGSITVPKRLKGSWIRLTLIAPDGQRATTVVKRAGR